VLPYSLFVLTESHHKCMFTDWMWGEWTGSCWGCVQKYRPQNER